jgi:hypothetical protein
VSLSQSGSESPGSLHRRRQEEAVNRYVAVWLVGSIAALPAWAGPKKDKKAPQPAETLCSKAAERIAQVASVDDKSVQQEVAKTFAEQCLAEQWEAEHAEALTCYAAVDSLQGLELCPQKPAAAWSTKMAEAERQTPVSRSCLEASNALANLMGGWGADIQQSARVRFRRICAQRRDDAKYLGALKCYAQTKTQEELDKCPPEPADTWVNLVMQ